MGIISIVNHAGWKRLRVPVDPVGLSALAADISAQGHTLIGAWDASAIEAQGTDATSWPASFGGFRLTAYGDTAPQFDAEAGTVSLDAAQAQSFEADDDALNDLDGNIAVVVVLKKPAGFSGEMYIAMLSQGTGAANLVLGLQKPLLDVVACFAGGVTGALGTADVTDQSELEAIHCARASLAGEDVTYVKRGRNATVTHAPAGTLSTGAVSRFVLGGDREAVPSAQRNLTTPAIAAVLLVKLADDTGYTDDLSDLINDWCETYAGASSALADPLGLVALDAALTAAGATLLPLWHSTHKTASGGALSAWPTTDDAMSLTAYSSPAVNATTGAINLVAGSSDSLQGDSSSLNVLTDGMALVIVGGVVGAGHLLNMSAGTGNVALQVRSDDGVNLGMAASGISGLHVATALAPTSDRRAVHMARMRSGADQKLLIAIGRTDATAEILPGAPMPDVTCSRITIAGTRGTTPPGSPYITCVGTTAIVPLLLPDGVDYEGEIQALLDDWCERYAGATP